jgi:chemotaxis-related protein WspD
VSQDGNGLVPGIQEHHAGTRLLDREIPEDYLHERTSHVAAERKRIEVGTKSVVIFRVSTEWFALPTEVFQEVDDYCFAHTVPHHRNGILNGLVNVRGELLLSISLAALLQLAQVPEAETNGKLASRRRLLICRRKGSRFAFPVDEVQAVHRYNPKDLRDIPATLAKAGAGTYVVGVLPWSDKSVGCLDDELLFYAADKNLA